MRRENGQDGGDAASEGSDSIRWTRQRPLSEHAMPEITVMWLGGQGGLVMLVSTCCTDVHKC